MKRLLPTAILLSSDGSSVPLFMLGFCREIDSTYLQEVAEAGGGRFLSTPEPGQVVGLYEQVLEHLKNQYSVVFPQKRVASGDGHRALYFPHRRGR